MAMGEESGDAPFWKLDSPEILSEDDVQELPTGRRKVGSYNKYMTSGSARKKQVKERNCSYCTKVLDGEALADHLRVSESCRILYSRQLRVKVHDDVDPIIIRLYSCISCHLTKRIILSSHLRKNPACLNSYRIRFKLDKIEDICKKIIALKKMSILSRQKLARSFENKEKRSKEVVKNQNKTVTTSLNEYRASVELANYRFCVKCNSNFNEASARVIKPNEEGYEDLCFSSMHFRRLEKFWMCKSCSDESDETMHCNVESSFEMKDVVRNDMITFFPWQNENHEEVSEKDINESEITIFFPKSCSALARFEDAGKLKSRRHLIRKMFEARSLDRADIAQMWENEMKKYRDAEMCSTRYSAVIKEGSKKVTNVEKLVDDSGIAGSSKWFRQQVASMQFRIDQFGSICFLVNIAVPKLNMETIATSLITEGFTVTMEKLGLVSGELVTKYLLHLGHMSDTDCSENCGEKIELKEYLESGSFDISSLRNKHCSTYVSSVHQKLIAFVKTIVKSPNCELFSKDYHFMIKFDTSGSASLVGLIWPEQLDACNLEVAVQGGISDGKFLTNFIDRAVSASSDARVLRSIFKVSDVEAEDLAQAVRDNQIHLCSSEDCEQCLKPSFPSLVTLLKVCPDSNDNLETANRMKLVFLKKVRSLSIEQKTELSTYDWLESIWDLNDVQGHITDDLKYLTVWMEDDEFQFKVDKRFSSLLGEFDPFTAVYHYIISCCDHEDQFNVVLKRVRILDCFTKPFNNIYLKAANSCVLVMPVRGCKTWERLISFKEPKEPEVVEDGMDLAVIWSHQKISLAEAISLFDSRKKRIETSASTVFVNARQQRRTIFKKLNEVEEESFKIDGGIKNFEIVKTIISRHFNRVNGKSLVLAESASWYEFPGVKESEELSKLYIEAGCEVPLSEIQGVASMEENLYLPEYLLLKNGEVMKKRPRQKVLTYPRFPECSYEESYSRLLLFYPLECEEELLSGNIRDLICQTNDDNENIVEKNERYVRLSGYNVFITIIQETLPKEDNQSPWYQPC